MNTQGQTTDVVSLPPAPYVGMRPFERNEQAIFFGRKRDAALLRDKVFSARLTVLYGPSGIGKSSILRTLLVPFLEDQEARVIYFDDWSGDDPTATLRGRLIEEASKLKIPDAGAGGPSLTDLVRLMISVDDRTVVLVLDQFEEFFTHGHRLDPLRKQIGSLVRTPDLDVRLLLSLREEHLASLEPLRAEILNLFQSTYRLDPLGTESLREAIEGPAKLFGAHYEPDLVSDLIAGLPEDSPDSHEVGAGRQRRDGGEAPTDLPILQLVCDELWKEARGREQAKRRGEAEEQEQITISRGHYLELGSRRGIVEKYLRGVMPHRWREKQLTARLMRHLAPPDGHKVSFSAKHLAEVIEVPRARVQLELDRLSSPEIRVLRSRGYESGHTLYELWHDSFIRIIAPWRDDVLKRLKLLRWSLRAAGVLTLIVILAFSLDWLILRRNTEGIMTRSDLSVEQKFDHVAFYLLWTRSGYYPIDIFSNRFDILRRLLEKHGNSLPPGYGIERSGLEFVILPKRGERWPLTVHYSPKLDLNEAVFTQTWQRFAKSLATNWGILTPLRLKLVPDHTYSKELVTLTGEQIKKRFELEIPACEGKVVIRPEQLFGPGKAFFERFKDEFKPIVEREGDGPLWLVPSWSLPAWKASGLLAQDCSSLPALLLGKELSKQRDRLLTPDAVEILLDNVRERHPDTTCKARTVRRDQLVEDFREIVKKGRSLSGLPTLLAILANYPERSSTEIVDEVIRDLESAQASPPRLLEGSPAAPVSPGKACAQDTETRAHWAYREAARWLPTVVNDRH